MLAVTQFVPPDTFARHRALELVLQAALLLVSSVLAVLDPVTESTAGHTLARLTPELGWAALRTVQLVALVKTISAILSV